MKIKIHFCDFDIKFIYIYIIFYNFFLFNMGSEESSYSSTSDHDYSQSYDSYGLVTYDRYKS